MKSYIIYCSVFAISILSVSLACSTQNPGEQIFKKRCAMCHKLPDPRSYNEKDWKDHVDRMAQRAGITPEQITQIKGLRK